MDNHQIQQQVWSGGSPNLGGKLCGTNGKARKMEPYWVQRIVNESQMLNTNFNPVLCTYT